MNDTVKRLLSASLLFIAAGAAVVLLMRNRGCREEENIPGESGVLSVATFNIAWLGDGVRDRVDRSEEDYKRIAAIISQGNPDIMALEEIENPAAVQRLLRYLEGYKFYLGRSGRQQNVGVIYKNSLSVESSGEYMPVAINPGRNRPGYIIQVKKGNFDCLMMVVHLKSSSHYDSTAQMRREARETRSRQAELVAQWADSVMNAGREEDILILGDFNDFPRRKKDNSLTALLADLRLEFLTYDTRSCAKGFLYTIDHIVVSKSVKSRLLPNGLQVLNFRNSLPDEQASMISDHCPVFARFSSAGPDND